MQVLSIMSVKINDEPKIGTVNMKSFKENLITIKIYQEALKYTEKICHKYELRKAEWHKNQTRNLIKGNC